MFANHIPDKGLISEIYFKNSYNSILFFYQILKWTGGLNRYISKEDMANRHMIRYSTSGNANYQENANLNNNKILPHTC